MNVFFFKTAKETLDVLKKCGYLFSFHVILQPLSAILTDRCAALFKTFMISLTGREIWEALRLIVQDHLPTTPPDMVYYIFPIYISPVASSYTPGW